MCGIAGQYNYFNKLENQSKILQSMSHRGPDAQAFWEDEQVVLFHSRLSIIDTSISANQPMIDLTGRYVLIFNGEIYNYRQLKAKLNYNWQTASDSEVLLVWLIKYGETKLDELEGMFAFAFYDKQKKELLMSRDRFGKKPLYIKQTKKTFSFASELRTLLVMHPDSAYTTSHKISNWLYWQTIPEQSTLLPEISQLKPGSYLKITQEKLIQGDFCNWHNPVIKNIEEIECLTKLRILVKEAVKKRLVSDVPFASFLSGGVDSSIITSLAAQELGSELNTFTISFDENEFSEHRIAAEVAERYQTKHHEIRLKPNDFLEEIENGLTATDHPSADGLNTYVVSKQTRKAGFKMALSGIGGDEWFLGYPYFKALDAWKKRKAFTYLSPFAKLFPFQYRKGFEIANHLNLGAGAYSYQRILFDSYTLKNYFGLPEPDLNSIQPKFPDNMSARSIEEWKYYSQPVLLRDSDQYSMAVGLELRSPFMDQKLVDFALSLPDQLKVGNKSKHLLIEAFKDLLPNSVYNRPKQGFTLPWEIWMRNELSSFCSQRIQSFGERIDQPKLINEWQKFLKQKSQFSWSRWWGIVAIEDWLFRNNVSINFSKI
jgi:asparagine synthase (glutamine-hydrolysing)